MIDKIIFTVATLLPTSHLVSDFYQYNPYAAYQQQQEEEVDPFEEREQVAASWAKKVIELDEGSASSVHLLWDTLRRRKAELEDLTEKLSDLLYDNAMFRQDFYQQNAQVLLSRYQAIDARFSIEVANQLNALYARVKGVDKPELSRAYAEMLGELGAEGFTTHQVQIAKELVQQDAACERALYAIAASENLEELEFSLRSAEKVIEGCKNNGLLIVFNQADSYTKLLKEIGRERLDNLLVEDVPANSKGQLTAILQMIGAGSHDSEKYIKRFEGLRKTA